jgi:hypothetical protein
MPRGQQLDRYRPAERLIVRPPDHRHAARAEALD